MTSDRRFGGGEHADRSLMLGKYAPSNSNSFADSLVYGEVPPFEPEPHMLCVIGAVLLVVVTAVGLPAGAAMLLFMDLSLPVVGQ